MASSFVDLTLLSQGLLTDGRGLAGTVSNGGLPTYLDPPPPPADLLRIPPVIGSQANLGFTPEQLAAIKSTTVQDAQGNLIIPTAFGTVDLGSGYNLAFDPDTLQGRITPAFATQALNNLHDVLGDATFTYTGSDCRVIIEVAETPQTLQKPRFAKQVLELTTVSISIHRAKSQVRAWGYINPKGVARAGRTIAGTMVMTKFTADVLMAFLQAHVIRENSKDSFYMKVDQLPPFNMSLVFTNEYGYASYQRLLGVEFVTEGNVYSVQDMLTEQTVTYLAKDFTPLLPLNLSGFFNPAVDSAASRKERTVRDVWEAKQQTVEI